MKRLVAAVGVVWLLWVPSLTLAQSESVPGARIWLTEDRVQKILDSAAVETPKLVTYLIFLGAGWLIGKRLSVVWSGEQKERDPLLTGFFGFKR
jgi:hypothetical protein